MRRTEAFFVSLTQLRAFLGKSFGLCRFFVFFVQQVLHLGLLCHLVSRPVQLRNAHQLQRVLLRLLQCSRAKALFRVVVRRPCKDQRIGLRAALLHRIRHAAAGLCKLLCTAVAAGQLHIEGHIATAAIYVLQRFHRSGIEIHVPADVLYRGIRVRFPDLRIGIGGGLLIIGTVLLMVQRTAACEALTGAPAQLILPVLCAALCLLMGLSCQDKLNTDMIETMQTQLHQRHYDSDTNSMPEGNLKNLPAWNKSDTPALEVTMEQPEKVYLRGQVYDTYTGTGWKAADTEDTAQYEDLFYWLHEANFYGQSQIALADGYTETATPLSMTIRNLSACSAHGYYPYAVYGSETLAADRIGDTNLPPTESLYYLKGSVPDWYQIQRNLSTAQGRENIETYLSKEQAYADYLRAIDLQMTQDSWAVLRRQLKLDTQARTISDIRTIIFDYLREAMTYDETARTMNGSGDFLQYTLERSGHGYSVHYATAAVLMLRYMGVPARYVEGYYLSAEDATRYKAGETITLTEENAHAWAEYYVSGVGFVPFEVTPGYIDDEELSLGGDSPDENTYENNTQQFVEVERPEEVNEHKQDRFTFSLNAHYLLLLPLLLILLLAGCIFHRRRVFRKKMAAIDAANDREAIAMRYGYAVCLLRHSTVQFPEDAAEAAELNQKALFSTQEMTPEQRKQVDSFAVRVLDACKGSWTTWEKIRYRLWNCLY